MSYCFPSSSVLQQVTLPAVKQKYQKTMRLLESNTFFASGINIYVDAAAHVGQNQSALCTALKLSTLLAKPLALRLQEAETSKNVGKLVTHTKAAQTSTD
jgi:hypothetical protein